MKTYTAATGYVYQYYFVGKREAPGEAEGAATEFVFDVTPDRKTTYAASVFLLRGAADAWAAAHGRSLSDTEQYAAAKLRLFQGFDEVENFREAGRRLVIEAGNLEELLGGLGVE
ncbi:MAG: hypothetical protein JO187_00145 [Acidobacteria bacterium]|nr:hypothetical protein [Acidobacteriota bacterium]